MSAAAEAPKAPSGKKALLIPIAGAVVATALVTGGAMYFLMPKEKPAKHAAAAAAEGDDAAAAEHGDSAEGEAEAAPEGEGEGAAAEGGGHEGKKAGSALYVPLTPSFVVNIGDNDTSHFLQIEMQVRAKNAAAVDALKLHDPQIRNAILMLLGAQALADVTSREGKEALQKKVLAEIQRILKAETGKTGVDAIYFTSFVMQ